MIMSFRIELLNSLKNIRPFFDDRISMDVSVSATGFSSSLGYEYTVRGMNEGSTKEKTH